MQNFNEAEYAYIGGNILPLADLKTALGDKNV